LISTVETEGDKTTTILKNIHWFKLNEGLDVTLLDVLSQIQRILVVGRYKIAIKVPLS